MTINPQRAQALFLAALEVSDPTGRTELLDRECKDDAVLRQRVEDLLSAHGATSGFDAAPSEISIQATFDSSPAPQTGTLIAGRYKLLERVGEGGMGSVWVAEQSVPVKRKVALKLIKAGMDSKAVLARFDAERQALALMDHPNIARVLDAGTTESGRPYFAMELVKGTPITEFCDARKLNPRQRLELFVPVCQAIQHAHQKGIIHRDIKPSNVLVAMYDDRPVPKVIDFGIAKATGQSLTDQSVYTGFGAVVGTPEYMSPEQASINNLDIDTRSDVYSLGVLLYELLTGATPVDRKSLGKAALLEILRIVREVEAPRPSSKLSTIDTLPSVAANRGTEPAKLSKLMKGELDWVLLKALEKDRTRRYDTANGLARDIQRYLDDEVVEARPPSTSYRLQKIVRRHKGQVIAASLVLFALLAGIAGTTVGLIEAKRQEQKALAAAKEERKAKLEAEGEKANALKAAEAEILAKLDADAKRKDAERNLDFAKKGNEILGSVFAGLDPKQIAESGRPLQDVLRENLVKAVKELDGSAIGDPLDVAAMQNTLGGSLLGLGEYEMATEVFAKAVDTRKAKLGSYHPDTLESMGNLATAYQNAGKLDLALTLHEETMKSRKTILGPDHPDTLAGMINLSRAYQAAGKLDLALPLHEETLRLTKAKLGLDHPSTIRSMNNIALAYREARKLDLALPIFEETLRLSKAKFGHDHPNTLGSMGNLAGTYLLAKKLDQALPLQEETLKLEKATLGQDHPNTLRSMGNLARMYLEVKKLELALPLCKETLKLTKAKLGPDHPSTLMSMKILARAYLEDGKLDLALPLFEETLKLEKDQLGTDHPETLASMGNLANAYRKAGKLDLSLPLYEDSLKLGTAKLGTDHPDTLAKIGNLAGVYQEAGKLELAMPLFEETLKLRKAKLGFDHPDTLRSMGNLASAYRAAKKFDLALPMFEEKLKLQKAKLGPEHPDTLTAMGGLASCYWSLKQLDNSIPLFEELLPRQEKSLGRDHPSTLNSVANLGVNYKDADRVREAIPLLEEAYRASKTIPTLKFVGPHLFDAYERAGERAKLTGLGKEQLDDARKTLPNDSPQLAGQISLYGLALLGIGEFDEAEPLLRECLAIRETAEPDKWTTFNTLSMLGAAVLGQKRYADAEPLLLRGFEGMKARETTIPRGAVIRIPEALERLVELYTNWPAAEPDKGSDVKAAEWQKKLDEHKAAAATEPPQKKS